MAIPKKRLGDILIDCNLISDEQLKQALTFQRDRGMKLGEALAEMGLVTEDDIIWALGNQLNISFIHLNPDIVDAEVSKLITPEFARDHKLMPLYKAGNQFSVCMVDPLDSRPIEFLEGKFGVEVSVSICTVFDFETTYSAIYGPIDVQEKVAPSDIDNTEKQTLERGIPKGMEGPEKVINYILGQAIINRVNRIHFEPSEKGVLIRFRTNNVLSRKIEIPVKVHHEVISRLKKLSQIPDKELNREGVLVGHFRVTVSNRQVNIQSIFFPTVNGEMVILKFSDFGSIGEQLGRNGKAAIEELINAVKTTHGVLYVTGPRESGRTTTQYCIMSSYEADTHKLVTIESPVVAALPKTTQIQVGSGGMEDSLSALKLALLLDADVIYLDDLADAKIVEEVAFAALGGKTVLTSFLAYDASSSIIKLLETSIDPVLIASSMCGVASQRLVRFLCPKCKQPAEIPAEVAELLPDVDKTNQIYKPQGCDGCNNTGYAGRTLVTEFIAANATLRQMIINRQTYHDFKSFARKNGIKSIEEKTLEMMLNGETSADEFMRLF
ncbi:MAG TPA: ATPase, T2SS/T4P/T4SS family [Candidatus Rifleibacterium sp.]|nr:ATPase, T2SS/T4P/T4SS family [Candidatus Rifleibacterium sp.]HPT46479.1 ATPase, T2SS/T4P/T4SS family [Candidatus Rifleibacterium sp.]